VTERSVTAFDLTFSAPKSVSMLYALGDPDVVAVVDAEGVFGVRYRHRTSRALDPQLHDHVLISNAVRTMSDGGWCTLDAHGLYRQAKAAGRHLADRLPIGCSVQGISLDTVSLLKLVTQMLVPSNATPTGVVPVV